MRIDGRRLILDGEVTLARHVELRSASAEWLGDRDLEVDWGAVTAVDSSALSLILSWQRALSQSRRTLVHRQIPNALLALADLYGVKDLLHSTA